MSTPLQQAIKIIGVKKPTRGIAIVADRCGVSYQAARKWFNAGRLPRTEWTGETRYAEIIEAATDGQITRQQLLSTPTRSAS
jgi:DNA-binding transcriptional regulator YdaS (Cro superfamily)